MDTELVLPMYNVHPYFSFKIVVKKWALYMENYGKILMEWRCISNFEQNKDWMISLFS